ncbi:MAG: glycosyltransferase [Candidatus Taylorbacteria bacterium]
MDTGNKKKLLYIITKSNWGGAQRYVFDLASAFKEEYDIVVAFGGAGVLKTKLEAVGIQTVSIPFLERDTNLSGDAKVFIELFKLVFSLRPNIVHLNSSKIGGLGVLAARLCNFIIYLLKTLHVTRYTLHPIRIIFTAHGFAFNENRGQVSKHVMKILYWIIIFFSHKTIAVSESLAHQMKNMFFTRDKIVIIHNGISKIRFIAKGQAQKFFIEKSQIVREFFGLDEKKIKKTLWIGTISELHKSKGLEYCIEALSLFKNHYPSFVFLIIGDGEEKENLEKLIKSKGLENHVVLLGTIENAALYLKAFDIFTLTSTTEGLPYAILEAGQTELAVIASNVGGIPEIIEQLQSGILVRSKHVKEIQDALLFLLENKDKKREMKQNLKARIESKFILQKMIDATKRVYENK